MTLIYNFRINYNSDNCFQTEHFTQYKNMIIYASTENNIGKHPPSNTCYTYINLKPPLHAIFKFFLNLKKLKFQ